MKKIMVEVPRDWDDGPGDTGESVRALVAALRPDIPESDVTVERVYAGVQRVTININSGLSTDIKIVNGEVKDVG